MKKPYYDVIMPSDVPPTDDLDAEVGPSRSQLKREALALQELGVQMLALPLPRLRQLELPEELIEALSAAHGMHKRGSRKRQMQYIGRLMRHIDPVPLRRALEAIKAGRAVARRPQA